MFSAIEWVDAYLICFFLFYKGFFLATYLDLEFEDFIIELKTNNKKAKDSIITLLTFEIQLLIQYLCTNKKIFLFWITDDGIFFDEFRITKGLFDLLDMLIKFNVESDKFSSLKERDLRIKKIIRIQILFI